MIQVKLTNSYQDESSAISACGVCIGTNGTIKGFKKAIESGHLSILEHMNMTFLIEGISRACAQQLTRYRTNKPTQESQRHVNIAQNEIVMPKSIMNNPQAYDLYLNFMKQSKLAYAELVELGIPLEDSRFVTTQAETTKLVITFDCRNFIHQCQERLCNMAQWEIRELYKLMREEIKEVYPTVYAMCKTRCATCKEKRPCEKRKQ